MSRNKALFYLVLTSILWSMGGLFIKLIDCNSFTIAGARSGIAFLVISLVSGKKSFKPSKPSKMFVIGVLSYALLVILFVTSTKLTTSANAIMLQFTAPIWVALLSSFILKVKTSMNDWIIIIIVFSGILLFFTEQLDSGNLLGNLLAVLSGISMAMMIISMKYIKVEPIKITIYGNLLIFILSLPFLFEAHISLRDLLYLIILGVFQLGISYILYTSAIKHVSALEGILIPILEPILNPIWVLIFAGEKPGIYSILGSIIILTTITFRTIHLSKVSVSESI
ncbi:DMT family transporter [Oceanirhabdus sp. W0125-5]|uniref:DMT family transporter n=1 Tax=Oceanirhabdus sp. W0125-5 TaxID=2999116 RepID=UPI0022F2ADD6|nr:DMT family transporter [Oceanirhabdus sp. W0125-5]WBW97816.1 DMT family transporter [Oceanirhabdus sp. W0125-5]